jgi:hypothetical protein
LDRFRIARHSIGAAIVVIWIIIGLSILGYPDGFCASEEVGNWTIDRWTSIRLSDPVRKKEWRWHRCFKSPEEEKDYRSAPAEDRILDP